MEETIEWWKKIKNEKTLQGVQFGIRVSYLNELRAEGAGVGTATPRITLLSKCVEGRLCRHQQFSESLHALRNGRT